MALNTKRFFKCDPIVWPTLPPAPGFHGMPGHQAKEGALLLLEAGAPDYPALQRLAARVVQFSMQDAIELSQSRVDAKEKQRVAAREAGRRPAPRTIAPADTDEEDLDALAVRAVADSRPLPGMKSFAVRRHDTLTGKILTGLAAEGGEGRFTKMFRERYGIEQDARPLATAAARLEENGLLRRAEIGKRGGPSLWVLTDAGRLNAKALERNRPC